MSTAQAAPLKRNAKGKTYKPSVFRTTPIAYLYIFPVFIFLGIFTYFAMGFNIQISLFDWNGVSPNKIFVGLKNYSSLFADPFFVLALKNTAVFFFITIPVQAVFGLLLAYLHQKNLYGKGLTRSIIFLPNVMSLVVIG